MTEAAAVSNVIRDDTDWIRKHLVNEKLVKFDTDKRKTIFTYTCGCIATRNLYADYSEIYPCEKHKPV